jgi:hypothetical protein
MDCELHAIHFIEILYGLRLNNILIIVIIIMFGT